MASAGHLQSVSMSRKRVLPPLWDLGLRKVRLHFFLYSGDFQRWLVEVVKCYASVVSFGGRDPISFVLDRDANRPRSLLCRLIAAIRRPGYLRSGSLALDLYLALCCSLYSLERTGVCSPQFFISDWRSL